MRSKLTSSCFLDGCQSCYSCYDVHVYMCCTSTAYSSSLSTLIPLVPPSFLSSHPSSFLSFVLLYFSPLTFFLFPLSPLISPPPPPSQLFLVTSPPSLLLFLAPSLSSYLIISPLSLTSPSYLPLPLLFFSLLIYLSSFLTDYSTHHGAMLACLYTSILHTVYLLNSSLSTELSTTCVN